MREIKFRVYAKEKDNDGCIGFLEPLDAYYCQFFFDGGWRDLSYFNKHACFIVQQYTGLKDKNGVEIYEGDIIMFPLFENDNTVSYHYFQVIWDEFYSAWSFAKKDGKPLTHTGWKIYYSDTTEVIGNVFETPELLEQ